MGAGYSIRNPVVKSRKNLGLEQNYTNSYIRGIPKGKKSKKSKKSRKLPQIEDEEPTFFDVASQHLSDAISLDSSSPYEDVIPTIPAASIADQEQSSSSYEPFPAEDVEVGQSLTDDCYEFSIGSGVTAEFNTETHDYEFSMQSGVTADTAQTTSHVEQQSEGEGPSLDIHECINETQAVVVSEGSAINKHIDLVLRQDIQPTPARRESIKHISKSDVPQEVATINTSSAQANLLYVNSSELTDLDLFGLQMDSKDVNLRRIADIAYRKAANSFEACVRDEIQNDNFYGIMSKKDLEKAIDQAKFDAINVVRSLCVYPFNREAIIPYSVYTEHKLIGLIEGWRIVLNTNFAMDLEKREQRLLMEENRRLREEIERLNRRL